MSPIIPAELPALTINFEYGDGDGPECTRLPLELYKQFTAPNKAFPGHGYLEVNVSVIDMPADIEADWWGTPESKWMRQKVRRAEKSGYEFRGFDQMDYIDDLHEINTSLEERQGKPMSSSYVAKPVAEAPYGEQPCARHRRDWFGVFKDGKLYAYTNVLTCGEMLLFSRILGHGEFMKDDIMNLLVFEAAKHQHEKSGTRYAVYFLHHSGTEGLQFFKRKMGFSGYTVAWELARPGVSVPELPTRAEYVAPQISPVKRVYRGVIKRVPVVASVGKKVKKLMP